MKDVAYLVGVCMVATSILSAVFAVIGGGSAILDRQIVTGATVGGMGCVSAIVLFFFGMKLVRFGESKGDGEFDPATSKFAESKVEYVEPDLRAQFAHFDLSQLNTAGWMLFFATLGFLGFEITTFVLVFDFEDEGSIKLFGALAFLSALIFFFVGKSVLTALGIQIKNPK